MSEDIMAVDELDGKVVTKLRIDKDIELLSKIGNGSFGLVYKAIEKNDPTKTEYALKIIRIRDSDSGRNPPGYSVAKILREVELISKLKNECIVEYKGFWHERNSIYIQMELCEHDLESVLNDKRYFFKRNAKIIDDEMSMMEFFMSCHLFKEVLEGINYLHQLKPQIIHRDIKPTNVLVTFKSNARFLKICDFGWSTLHQDDSTHTTDIGDVSYQDPFIIYNKHYCTKCDIYSLGVLGTKIFDINEFRIIVTLYQLKSKIFNVKFSEGNNIYLFDILERMKNKVPDIRPTCEQVLNSLVNLPVAIYNNDALKYPPDTINEKTNFFFKKFLEAKTGLNFDGIQNVKQDVESMETDENDGKVSKIDPFEKLYVQNDRLHHEFANEEYIGMGTFGIVTKARHTTDNEEYAIKKIIIKSTQEFHEKKRELQIWAKLKNDNFVQYRSVWVEKYDKRKQDDFLFEMARKVLGEPVSSQQLAKWKEGLNLNDFAVIHIQMDLCVCSLKEVIESIKTFYNIKRKQFLPPIAYYIASELLVEILNHINYLHEFDPPILHRDIKPGNILITNGINGQFCKLADFGIAVLHNGPDASHTQMRGTEKYMAPEVMSSRKYDTKADVYSIGVVTQELFNFDINSHLPDYIFKQYPKIIDITGKTMNGQRKARPTCAEILKSKSQWALDYSDIKGVIVESIDLNQNYDIISEFIPYFLKTKYNCNNR